MYRNDFIITYDMIISLHSGKRLHDSDAKARAFCYSHILFIKLQHAVSDVRDTCRWEATTKGEEFSLSGDFSMNVSCLNFTVSLIKDTYCAGPTLKLSQTDWIPPFSAARRGGRRRRAADAHGQPAVRPLRHVHDLVSQKHGDSELRLGVKECF